MVARVPEAEGVRIERHGAVAVVAVDNGPLNLLTQGVRKAMGDAFEGFAADESVRAVVVASGVKHFCAGADMKEFPERFDPRAARRHGLNGQRMTLAIARCPVPVIAAIEGVCLGGGMEIALACDLRVAAAGATMGLPEIRRGVWPGTGGMYLLTRLVGPAVAKDFVMTGDIFDAAALKPYRVVDVVVPDGHALEVALARAETLAARPARSVRTIKRLIDREFIEGLELHLAEELEAYVACYQTADAREGNAAFFEKRDPEWSHR